MVVGRARIPGVEKLPQIVGYFRIELARIGQGNFRQHPVAEKPGAGLFRRQPEADPLPRRRNGGQAPLAVPTDIGDVQHVVLIVEPRLPVLERHPVEQPVPLHAEPLIKPEFPRPIDNHVARVQGIQPHGFAGTLPDDVGVAVPLKHLVGDKGFPERGGRHESVGPQAQHVRQRVPVGKLALFRAFPQVDLHRSRSHRAAEQSDAGEHRREAHGGLGRHNLPGSHRRAHAEQFGEVGKRGPAGYAGILRPPGAACGKGIPSHARHYRFPHRSTKPCVMTVPDPSSGTACARPSAMIAATAPSILYS